MIYSFLTIQLNVTNAQPFGGAKVVVEEDSNSNVICKNSHESASAAIKSALRYNRIESLPKNTTGRVIFYTSLTNTEVTRDSCSMGLYMQVYFYTSAKMPQSDKSVFLRGELCSKSVTGFFDKVNMQERVNANLKRLVDECIAEIEIDLAKK